LVLSFDRREKSESENYQKKKKILNCSRFIVKSVLCVQDISTYTL